MQPRTVTKSRDWAVALDDARPPAPSQAWIGLAMAVAGGVAVLALAAAWMTPPAPDAPTRPGRATLAPLRSGDASIGWRNLGTPAAAPQTATPRPAPPPMAPPVRAAAPSPGAEDDPTVALAQAVPQAVPLARAQRDPSALARMEAAAAAAPPPTPPVVVETGAGPAQRTELARARVGEADLGLRLMPGSRPLPDSGRRVPDGAGGEAVALSVAASGTLDTAVQFYRQQWLADGTPADAVQVLRPGDGQALLRAQSPQGGERTVWIVQNGNVLDIVLARVRPGPPAQR